MKKTLFRSLAVAVLAAAIAAPVIAGTMDVAIIQAVNVTTTTNTPVTVVSPALNGVLKSIRIDVSASANMDLDVTASDGTVIYTKDDVTADTTIYPLVQNTGSAGTALSTYYGTTNYVYSAFPLAGPITLVASDEATTNKNVTLTIIYEKP